MPAPTPEQRAHVERLIADNLGRNEIVRATGLSNRAVTRIAADIGHDFADRDRTRAATKARSIDNAERRSVLAERMLDEASLFLDQLHGDFLVFSFGGRDNVYAEHVLERPPTADARNLMTNAAIAVDKHLALERHTVDAGGDAARSLVGGLLAAIRDTVDETDTPAAGES